MKNELIEARLRRDKSLLGFLDKAENRTRYADIEDDVAPRRTLLQTHLTTADALAQQVLGADEDNMPARKRGFRNQLTALLLRATRALRAHARSTSDTDLTGRPSDLTKLGETSFGEEARRLLDLAKPYDLTRRRYTAAHAAQAEDLLPKFTQGITDTPRRHAGQRRPHGPGAPYQNHRPPQSRVAGVF